MENNVGLCIDYDNCFVLDRFAVCYYERNYLAVALICTDYLIVLRHCKYQQDTLAPVTLLTGILVAGCLMYTTFFTIGQGPYNFCALDGF